MTVKSVEDGLRDYRNWLTDPRPRIGFGLPWFDSKTNGGMAKSEMTMLMAYSHVGKTTLALNVIRNNPHVPALFFSLEMNWRMVVARLAAMESGHSTSEIENSLRLNQPMPVLQETAEKFKLLVCDDSADAGFRQFDESFEAATIQLKQNPRLVIFDYLELIGGGGLMGKAEQVDKIAQKLRAFTKNHDCSTLVLHQVGKGDGESGAKPLALDSGRYGGFQPFDYVCGAYAPKLERGISGYEYEQRKEKIYLQLLKNRAGPSAPEGVLHRLDAKCLRLTEWNQGLWHGFQGSMEAV